MTVVSVLSTIAVFLSSAAQAREIPAPRFEEGAVLHSQRWFSEEWRKKFNAGDIVYCLQAYTPDATLHISFGPLAQIVEKLLTPLKNPETIRERVPIGAFWNASRIVLGFEEMEAFEDHGEYESSAMVVDENTVIVTSPVSFKSFYGKVQGDVLSEMWVRTEDKITWKIRSAMIALQSLSPLDGSMPATALPKQTPAPQPATPDTKAVQNRTSRPKDDVLAAGLNNTIGANATDSDKVPRGHTTFLAGLGILVALSIGAVMVRRAQNRRAAAISGFESMLG